MKPLVIVGAGGHGRETAKAWLDERPPATFLGFLDDGPADATPEGWPVLGPIARWPDHRHATFLPAVNDPRARRRVIERMRAAGEPDWCTFVAEGVRLHPSVRIGAGSMLLTGTVLTTSIRIGAFAIVNRSVGLGHDTEIGDFVSINPGAIVSGRVTVGNGVEIGSAAAIRQGLRIGSGAIVGLGAAVVKDVAAATVVAGNPARPLREIESW